MKKIPTCAIGLTTLSVLLVSAAAAFIVDKLRNKATEKILRCSAGESPFERSHPKS